MKKSGFTLIELLSVILILGIIALIAIPIVSNIINQSKKKAFEITINNVVSSVGDACQIQQTKGENITTMYKFLDGVVSPSLNVKGELSIIGTAVVDSNCDVTLSVTNGKFVATKKTMDDSITVALGDEIKQIYPVYKNGTAVYFNPETGTKCTSSEAISTTGTKTGCMKWYAFNDLGESSSSINLLLDHNSTALVSWVYTGSNINGPTKVLSQLQTDTNSWVGVPTRSDSYSVDNGTASYTINYSDYKARLITASEISTITGNSSFIEKTALNSNWFYLDSNNRTQTVTKTGSSKFGWLFDYTKECNAYGCNINDESTFGYWTSTSVYGVTNAAWSVTGTGNLSYGAVASGTTRGLRPVITVLKSSI